MCWIARADILAWLMLVVMVFIAVFIALILFGHRVEAMHDIMLWLHGTQKNTYGVLAGHWWDMAHVKASAGRGERGGGGNGWR